MIIKIVLFLHYQNIAFVGHILITCEDPKPWLWWHVVDTDCLTANTDWEWSPLEREMAILAAAVDIAMPVAIGTKFGIVTTLLNACSNFSSNISTFVFGIIYCSFNYIIITYKVVFKVVIGLQLWCTCKVKEFQGNNIKICKYNNLI